MMDPETLDQFADRVGAHFGWDVDYYRAYAAEKAKYEGTAANNNPFACTIPLEHSIPLKGNSAGVQNYATLADGVRATLMTLDPASYYADYTDFYQNIRIAIANRSIDTGGRAMVAAQERKWGTVGFADVILAGWDVHLGASVPVVSLNDAVLRRFRWLSDAVTALATSKRDAGDWSAFSIAVAHVADPDAITE